MRLLKLILSLGLVLFVHSLFGQVSYSVSGIVSDEHGLPLPGAAVVIQPDQMGTICDEEGAFLVDGLTPGDYYLEASFLGYEIYRENIKLNTYIDVDIQLKPLTQTLQEVTINRDYAKIRTHEESLNIEIVNSDFIIQNSGGSLMKSLERLPGVDAIGIGSSQSKPVIRGLSFNRVAVLENGIKHEGQQWGSDHGLEVDQYAIDHVEVIKGPSSLMYGSDAVGGIILLKHAAVPKKHTIGADINLTGKTNNQLIGGSVRVFGRKDKFYVSLRTTFSDYADYKVPTESVDIKSYPVDLYDNQLRNTAGQERALHLDVGYVNKGFSNRLFFSMLDSKNGFFANAHGLTALLVDNAAHDHSDRDVLHPYHIVNHSKVINQTVWRSESFKIEMDFGLQRNFRQEWSEYIPHGYMPDVFPDTMSIPSNLEREFLKYTYTANLRLTNYFSDELRVISGVQTELQNNKIGGRGFVIPAYRQSRFGIFSILKFQLSDASMISGGVRVDAGVVRTDAYYDWFESRDVEGLDSVWVKLQRGFEIEREFSNISWNIGYNFDADHFDFKANFGKSFRMPLAKELAANGVNYHRFSYEVGDSSLLPETAYQFDAGLEWHSKDLAMGVSPFVSYFPNYIYLNPDFRHDSRYGNGNQIFNYSQSEVFRYGGEVHVHYHLFDFLKAGLIGEYTYSQQLSGEKIGYTLPFSQPASLLLHLKYMKERFWEFSDFYASLDFRVAASQKRIVPPEEPTPGYRIVNLGVGTKVMFGMQKVYVDIQIQNLFNTNYLEHTSFYRLINVPEPGRNVVLNFRIPVESYQNQKQ